MNHKPMNMNSWNIDGTGNNIRNLFTPEEEAVWEAALAFQDKRGDTGHAEIVVYFAFQLLRHIGAKREIVIPAAILHDIGWSQISKEVLASFRDPAVSSNQDYRLEHEEKGKIMAEKILRELNYPEDLIIRILEIIDGHDTRKEFLNVEDGIVKDADKLWRYTITEWKIYPDPVKRSKRAKNRIDEPGFFYSNVAKEIARIELEQTRKILN